MMFYIAALSLIGVGLYIVLTKKNLVKVLIGISIADSGVNLLLISVGYKNGGTAPILVKGLNKPMVDPVPQALVLTAIVIGVATLALAMAVVIDVKRHFGTVELDKIIKMMRGGDKGDTENI